MKKLFFYVAFTLLLSSILSCKKSNSGLQKDNPQVNLNHFIEESRRLAGVGAEHLQKVIAPKVQIRLDKAVFKEDLVKEMQAIDPQADTALFDAASKAAAERFPDLSQEPPVVIQEGFTRDDIEGLVSHIFNKIQLKPQGCLRARSSGPVEQYQSRMSAKMTEISALVAKEAMIYAFDSGGEQPDLDGLAFNLSKEVRAGLGAIKDQVNGDADLSKTEKEDLMAVANILISHTSVSAALVRWASLHEPHIKGFWNSIGNAFKKVAQVVTSVVTAAVLGVGVIVSVAGGSGPGYIVLGGFLLYSAVTAYVNYTLPWIWSW